MGLLQHLVLISDLRCGTVKCQSINELEANDTHNGRPDIAAFFISAVMAPFCIIWLRRFICI